MKHQESVTKQPVMSRVLHCYSSHYYQVAHRLAHANNFKGLTDDITAANFPCNASIHYESIMSFVPKMLICQHNMVVSNIKCASYHFSSLNFSYDL